VDRSRLGVAEEAWVPSPHIGVIGPAGETKVRGHAADGHLVSVDVPQPGPTIRAVQASSIVVLAGVSVAFALPLDGDTTEAVSLVGTVATCLLMVAALGWASRVNVGINRAPWILTLATYAFGLALFVLDPIEPGPAGKLSAAMLVGPLATVAQLAVVVTLARQVVVRLPVGRVVLDTLWLSSAGLLLAWHLVGGPVVNDPQLLLGEQVAVISQLIALAILFGFVATILPAIERPGRRLFVLLASPAFLLGVALAAQARAGSAGELDHGTLADLAFPVAFAVGTVAVFESSRSRLIVCRDSPSRSGQLVAWLPLLAWLVTLVLEESSLIATTRFLGLIVGVGAIVRIAVAVRENTLLTRDLHSQTLTDHLTGLPNRAAMHELIEEFGDGPASLLLVDLDRFKSINDTMGHAAGDSVLVEMARRMQRSVGSSWTVGRLAGDEFVVVGGQCLDDASLIALGQTIVDEVSKPLLVRDRELWVSASIGAATTGDDLEADDLLEAADSALRSVKSTARGQVLRIRSGFHHRKQERRDLESALQVGLDQGQFRCVYQPKIDLITGAVVGLEALVRWERPGYGEVLPGAFIEVAEESGLITGIDDWVLRHAIRQLSDWNALDPSRQLGLSVNMSAWQLSRRDVHDRVAEVIGASGYVDASQLTIELTETALVEAPDVVARRLQRLRDVGVGVAIDDFGAGFTAISYLRAFPATEVKIDRSLVWELTGGQADDRSLAAAVIRLAHAMDLDVIAEGVETRQQAESLRQLGCRRAQGFLFSRPIAAEQVDVMLAGRHRLLHGDSDTHQHQDA
jgi:diguanylate cyclase (GGDEF)-like protein